MIGVGVRHESAPAREFQSRFRGRDFEQRAGSAAVGTGVRAEETGGVRVLGCRCPAGPGDFPLETTGDVATAVAAAALMYRHGLSAFTWLCTLGGASLRPCVAYGPARTGPLFYPGATSIEPGFGSWSIGCSEVGLQAPYGFYRGHVSGRGDAEKSGPHTEARRRGELPTTIAHSVLGAAVARVGAPSRLRGWWLAVFVVVMANLPDIDFLVGAIVEGSPRSWHRGPTHSLVGALVAAFLAAAVVGRARWRQVFLLGLALVGSHLAADLIMPDLREAAGIPLFWPVSRSYFTFTLPLPDGLRAFLDLPLGESTAGFVRSLLRWHTAAVFLVEGILFLPVLALAWLLRPFRAWSRGRSRVRDTSPRPSR